MTLDVEHFDSIDYALMELELLGALLLNHGDIQTLAVEIEEGRLAALGEMISRNVERIQRAINGISEEIKTLQVKEI